jgi:hypothetical protein
MDLSCFEFGTVHSMFQGFQYQILKLSNQQYRAWSDCMEVQAGLTTGLKGWSILVPVGCRLGCDDSWYICVGFINTWVLIGCVNFRWEIIRSSECFPVDTSMSISGLLPRKKTQVWYNSWKKKTISVFFKMKVLQLKENYKFRCNVLLVFISVTLIYHDFGLFMKNRNLNFCVFK